MYSCYESQSRPLPLLGSERNCVGSFSALYNAIYFLSTDVS